MPRKRVPSVQKQVKSSKKVKVRDVLDRAPTPEPKSEDEDVVGNTVESLSSKRRGGRSSNSSITSVKFTEVTPSRFGPPPVAQGTRRSLRESKVTVVNATDSSNSDSKAEVASNPSLTPKQRRGRPSKSSITPVKLTKATPSRSGPPAIQGTRRSPRASKVSVVNVTDSSSSDSEAEVASYRNFSASLSPKKIGGRPSKSKSPITPVKFTKATPSRSGPPVVQATRRSPRASKVPVVNATDSSSSDGEAEIALIPNDQNPTGFMTTQSDGKTYYVFGPMMEPLVRRTGFELRILPQGPKLGTEKMPVLSPHTSHTETDGARQRQLTPKGVKNVRFLKVHSTGDSANKATMTEQLSVIQVNSMAGSSGGSIRDQYGGANSSPNNGTLHAVVGTDDGDSVANSNGGESNPAPTPPGSGIEGQVGGRTSTAPSQPVQDDVGTDEGLDANRDSGVSNVTATSRGGGIADQDGGPTATPSSQPVNNTVHDGVSTDEGLVTNRDTGVSNATTTSRGNIGNDSISQGVLESATAVSSANTEVAEAGLSDNSQNQSTEEGGGEHLEVPDTNNKSKNNCVIT